jgi:HEAT repeat protein
MWLSRYLLGVVIFHLVATALGRAQTPDIQGGFRGQLTLGALTASATNIAVLEVERADPMEGEITFKTIADLKGKLEETCIRHYFGVGKRALLPARDQHDLWKWASPGKRAIAFLLEDTCSVCLGSFWYYCERDDKGIWVLDCVLHTAAMTYCGSVDRLREHVTSILRGQDVIVTATASGDPLADWFSDLWPIRRDWLHGKKGRVCRVRAGLKITELDDTTREDAPHFVGWGVGDAEIIPALVKSLRHPDSLVRAEAAVDLGSLGANGVKALPALRQAFCDPDGYVAVYAAEAVAIIDPAAADAVPFLVRMLKHRSAGPRGAAAAALASLEPPRREAVPALTDALRHDQEDNVRAVAALALGRLGADTAPGIFHAPEVVDALAEALRRDPDAAVRLWSAHALRCFGFDARSTIPALGAALTDESYSVAHFAAATLERFGPASVPLFANVIASGNCPVKKDIITYLADLGPAARQAVPALREALNDESAEIKVEAAAALRAIDRPTAVREAVPALINVMPHHERMVLRALSRFGSDARAALPAIIQSMHDSKGKELKPAIDVLGAIGPAAEAAVGPLRQLVVESDPSIRVAALQALARIGRTEEAVAGLLEEFQGADAKHEPDILRALANLGTKARAAAPALRAALRNKDRPYRTQMALALWRVGQVEEAGGVVFDLRQDALDALIDMLADEPTKWSEALETLKEIGPEAQAAVPCLIRFLDDSDYFYAAAETLGAIGPAAHAAEPRLRAALTHKNSEIRLHAALALCQIEGAHPSALTELLKNLDKHPSVLSLMDDVLVSLGAKAKAATPMLLRHLRDQDRNLHHKAARVLKAVNPDVAAQAGVP